MILEWWLPSTVEPNHPPTWDVHLPVQGATIIVSFPCWKWIPSRAVYSGPRGETFQPKITWSVLILRRLQRNRGHWSYWNVPHENWCPPKRIYCTSWAFLSRSGQSTPWRCWLDDAVHNEGSRVGWAYTIYRLINLPLNFFFRYI